MASYPMPPDTSAREKIVGGLLDWTQLLWLLAGLVVGLLIGGFLNLFLSTVGLVIGLIPGIAGGLYMGFAKIHQLTVINYIRYSIKHKKKTKRLPNVRLEALDDGKTISFEKVEEVDKKKKGRK